MLNTEPFVSATSEMMPVFIAFPFLSLISNGMSPDSFFYIFHLDHSPIVQGHVYCGCSVAYPNLRLQQHILLVRKSLWIIINLYSAAIPTSHVMLVDSCPFLDLAGRFLAFCGHSQYLSSMCFPPQCLRGRKFSNIVP
jgi:hypothetical protein